MKPINASDQLAWVQRLSSQTRLRLAVASPYFIIWGVAWAAGYVAEAFKHGVAWAVILPVASVATIAAFWADRRRRPRALPNDARQAMSVYSIFGIAIPVFAAVFVNSTHDTLLIAAYYPVAFGVLFFAVGIYVGRAFRAMGAWCVIVGLASLLFSTQAGLLLLAGAVGGGMMLFGLGLWRFLRSSPAASAP
jgi:hypothetical protein